MALTDVRPTEPPEFRDPVAVIDGCLDELSAETRDGWSDAGITARVRDLADVHRRSEIELVRVVARWDAAGLHSSEGYFTAQSWLVREAGLARGAAQRVLAVARLCQRHDPVAVLFYAGRLPMAKAAALGRVVTDQRREHFERDQHKVLSIIEPLDNDAAVRLIGHWARLVDDELGIEPADARSKRFLHLSRSFEGMVVIDGLLDPETGAIVLAALDALDQPDAADDPARRSYSQRQADNLAEMARRSMATNGHLDPDKTINVVIDADLIDGEPCTQDCSDDCEGHAPTPRAASDVLAKRSTINGQPINPKLVLGHLCDSWISRIVLGPDGVLLDLGRRTRLFTPAQRRAIIVRDVHCVFPGCDHGPERCQTHHINPWTNGGETNADDGALTCGNHHRYLHTNNLTLKRVNGTWRVVPMPDTRPPPDG